MRFEWLSTYKLLGIAYLHVLQQNGFHFGKKCLDFLFLNCNYCKALLGMSANLQKTNHGSSDFTTSFGYITSYWIFQGEYTTLTKHRLNTWLAYIFPSCLGVFLTTLATWMVSVLCAQLIKSTKLWVPFEHTKQVGNAV